VAAVPAAAGSPAVHDRDWVIAQAPDHYTLQVAAGRTAEALTALLERHAQGAPAACFLHRPGAREPYSGVVGSFARFAEAERALAGLPAELRSNTPWIRRFATLQRELPPAPAASGRADGAGAIIPASPTAYVRRR
jgi:DamX protein